VFEIMDKVSPNFSKFNIVENIVIGSKPFCDPQKRASIEV